MAFTAESPPAQGPKGAAFSGSCDENAEHIEHHAALTAVEKAWQWNHVAPLLTKRAASVESHDDRARRARVEEDNAEDGASSPPSPNTDRDAHEGAGEGATTADDLDAESTSPRIISSAAAPGTGEQAVPPLNPQDEAGKPRQLKGVERNACPQRAGPAGCAVQANPSQAPLLLQPQCLVPPPGQQSQHPSAQHHDNAMPPSQGGPLLGHNQGLGNANGSAYPSHLSHGGWVYIGGHGGGPWAMPPVPQQYPWAWAPPFPHQWCQHPPPPQGAPPTLDSVTPIPFSGSGETAISGGCRGPPTEESPRPSVDVKFSGAASDDNPKGLSDSPEMAAVVKAKAGWKGRGPKTVGQLYDVVESFERLCAKWWGVASKKQLQKCAGLTSSIWEWAKQVNELKQCQYPRSEESATEMEVLRKRGWEWKSATHYFIVKAGAGPHLAAGGCCRPQVRLPSESKGAASGTVEPPVASSNSSATLTGARLSAVASADARLPEARESRDAAGSTAGSPEGAHPSLESVPPSPLDRSREPDASDECRGPRPDLNQPSSSGLESRPKLDDLAPTGAASNDGLPCDNRGRLGPQPQRSGINVDPKAVQDSPELASVMMAKAGWSGRGPKTVGQLYDIVESFEHLCATWGRVVSKKELQKRAGLTSSIWEWTKQVNELRQCEYPKSEEAATEMERLRKRGWKWKSVTHYLLVKAGAGPHVVTGDCCRPQLGRTSDSRGTTGGKFDSSVTSRGAASTGARSSAARSAGTCLPVARESGDAPNTSARFPEVLASPGGKDTAATQAGGEHSPDGEVAPRMTDASPAGRSNPDTSEIRKADEARAKKILCQFLCEGGYVDTRLRTRAETRRDEESIASVLASIIFYGLVRTEDDVDKICPKIIARGFPAELVDAGIAHAEIVLDEEQRTRISELNRGHNRFLGGIKTWDEGTGRVWRT